MDDEHKGERDVIFYHERCVPLCDHSFGGWREHDDGLGGEQVCSKCGMGAMEWTLSLDI